jgi:hypothetical protein
MNCCIVFNHQLGFIQEANYNIRFQRLSSTTSTTLWIPWTLQWFLSSYWLAIIPAAGFRYRHLLVAERVLAAGYWYILVAERWHT